MSEKETKKQQLLEAFQAEMKTIGNKLKEISDKIQQKDFTPEEDTLKERDELRKVLKGISELFDEVPSKEESDFESEYSLISTDSDDTFVLLYFNPDKNDKLEIFHSHANREDALNKLKDIIEEREGKKKIKEKVDGS